MIYQSDRFIGRIINERYRIIEQVGQGGMGTVYLAEQAVLQRQVAIKLLSAQLSEDKVSVKRFEQEASASSSLQHPNLIMLYDYGMIDGKQPYLAMEYLQGDSLTHLLRQEGRINPVRCARIFTQIMDGLHYAHNKGVVHRDIKPSNIILINSEEHKDLVKVVDFGLAKLMPWSGKESQHLTKTGEVFGSPIYMSPEQCSGMKLEPSSDIYSLGITLFEALTGKVPFRGDNIVQTASKHLSDKPPLFADICPELNLSDNLQAVILKALEKKPANRYLNMLEFKEALNKAVSGPNAGLGNKPFIPTASVDSTQPVKKSDLDKLSITNQKSTELKKVIAQAKEPEKPKNKLKPGWLSITVTVAAVVAFTQWQQISSLFESEKSTTGTVYYLNAAASINNRDKIDIKALHLHTDRELLKLSSNQAIAVPSKESFALGKIWDVTYSKENHSLQILKTKTIGEDSAAAEANQVIANHFVLLAAGDYGSAWQDLSSRYKKIKYADLSEEKALQKFSREEPSDAFKKYSFTRGMTQHFFRNDNLDAQALKEAVNPTLSGTKIESAKDNQAAILADKSVFYQKNNGFNRYSLIKENGQWKIDQIEENISPAYWNKY
ncbi:MAG: serine/threonine protein kinase [Candidatus Obscuribacterales bacterium]|nr:serine/threonine protein kinase [Candidatus Obscuribacterales bacterium]